MSNDPYGDELQKLLIEFLISSQTLFSITRTIIKPDYWNREYRRTIEFLLEYADEYKNIPTPEVILAETNKSYKKIDDIDQSLENWFYNTIEKFCKHKAIEKTIFKGPDLIEKGQYGELYEQLKSDVLISLQKDLGTDYFKDPESRLKSLRDRNNMVSTGWKTVDRVIYGGFNRGELSIFVGGSGTGKSLFMQNLAINWVNMGLNILYISLELSENLVSLRLDSMFTGISTKDVMKDIENTSMKILAIKMDKTEYNSKPGCLQLKKMPEAGTSVNDIRAYIKEWEIQTGKKVDGICVDYLDLLYPNSAKVDINNTFSKDKYTSEELRSLASELNILCVSASQLNRCLTLDTQVQVCNPKMTIRSYRKEIKTLAEIEIGDYVLGQNDFVEVTNIYKQGKQKVYKVLLNNRRYVKCTSNHRFLTNKGLRSIDTGLDIGMEVDCSLMFNASYKNFINIERVKSYKSAITSIKCIGVEETVDIEVMSETSLFYANGILTHNSSTQTSDYDHSHIAGGVSKINTADNVIAILTNDDLKEKQEYQLQFLKTRSSSGVGNRIYLNYNSTSLRIFDKLEDPTMDTTPKLKMAEVAANKLKKKVEPEKPLKNSSVIKIGDVKPEDSIEQKNDTRLDFIKKLKKSE